MTNIKINQEIISYHLSREYVAHPVEHCKVNEKSLLSPQEVAAKIWDQWKQYRSLSVQLNVYFDFFENNPD